MGNYVSDAMGFNRTLMELKLEARLSARLIALF